MMLRIFARLGNLWNRAPGAQSGALNIAMCSPGANLGNKLRKVIMQTITKRILTQEHMDAGLRTEENDHCLYLFQGEKCIAIFGAHTTLKEIWAIADKHMADKAR